MNTWNREAIAGIMAECGKIALEHYDSPHVDFKKDRTVVTQADREIERHLERYFDLPQEGSYLIGEETLEKRSEPYVESALSKTAWVIDPIDGTSLYANHLPDWGVSIGFMRGGVLEEGAVYLPIQNELFMTAQGGLFHGAPEALMRIEGQRRPYSHDGIVAITQEIARTAGLAVVNPVFAGGSAVFPLTHLVLGRFIAYVGQLKLWDVAGSLPLLRVSGFRLQLDDGTPVGNRVDETICFLQAGDPHRWRFRANLICAGAEESIAKVIEGLSLARERRR